MGALIQTAEIPTIIDSFLRETSDENVLISQARTSPFMLWLLDKDGQCTFSNKAMAEFTGLTPEQTLYNGWIEAVHPEDFPEKSKLYEKVMQTHETERTILRLRAADEQYYTVVNIVYPRSDQCGNIIGYTELCHRTDPLETSRLNQIKDTLSTEVLPITKLILDTTANAVILTVVPGICLYMNKAAEDMTGYTLDELKGKAMHDTLHHTNPDGTARKPSESPFRAAVLERRALKNFEDFIIRRDGSVLPVMCNFEPIYEKEIPIGALLEMRDITEEKKAKAELLTYTQRLKESNKELEHFATIASHDLQEPLRKVMLFSDHLSKVTQGKLEHEAEDDLQRILSSVGRMQRLIEDLLNLSKVTRRGQPFQRLELEMVTNEVLSELHYFYPDIRSRVQVRGKMAVEADSNQMHQMLSQLLDNALKFHAPDKCSKVQVTIQPGGSNQCIISVHDDGVGIKAEHQSRIFDAFVRLHHERSFTGTGMGLTLVQKIVERHGGSIQVDSTPDEGSTFTITLPVMQT